MSDSEGEVERIESGSENRLEGSRESMLIEELERSFEKVKSIENRGDARGWLLLESMLNKSLSCCVATGVR